MGTVNPLWLQGRLNDLEGEIKLMRANVAANDARVVSYLRSITSIVITKLDDSTQDKKDFIKDIVSEANDEFEREMNRFGFLTQEQKDG